MPMCDDRPDYPFNDLLPGAVGVNTRHHIIPWRELCEIGRDYIADDEKKITVFFESYNDNTLLLVNLGEWGGTNQQKILNGEDGLINQILIGNAAAREELAGLLAWLPGNLVLGPTNRPHNQDPGEAFDVFACNRRANTDLEYGGLQVTWTTANDLEKYELVRELADKIMLDDLANANLW